MNDYLTKLYFEFRDKIYEGLDSSQLEAFDRDETKVQFLRAISSLSQSYNLRTTIAVREQLADIFLSEIFGLGPLEELIKDNSISDILVNGYNRIYIERNGILEKTNISFMGEQQLLEISKRIASRVGRTVDMSHPMVDARLSDGSRVNIVLPPISIEGVQLSIRKFNGMKHDIYYLASSGMLPEGLAKLLVIATRCKANMLISGGTGSGKTTLLNALSEYIDPMERVVTIEDAAELELKQPHVVRLETKLKSQDSVNQYSARELLINSLRMRPDRLLVGECRGAEAFEMLQAMNTGHSGSMSTLHANSAQDAFSRVEAMVMMANLNLPLLAIRRNIVSAVDLFVQVDRFPDGTRRVTNVCEVRNMEGETPVLDHLYDYNFGTPTWNKIQSHSRLYQKARLFSLENELLAYAI